MDLTQLENTIGYHFQTKELLTTALTHSSYANEHKRNDIVCNERLEFLGDSVLGLLCARLIYEKYPQKPEGELSKMRSALVCETALATYSKTVHLGQYLLVGHGEEMAGGRERPSTVADAFEALIAAIYLDGGMENARAFVLPFLENAIAIDTATHAFRHDYKTMLQEIAQQNPGEIIRYETVAESGPDHDKRFTVSVFLNSNMLATGTGKSKKDAEQDAAHEALRLMGENV